MTFNSSRRVRCNAQRPALNAVLCLLLVAAVALSAQEILRNADIVTMTTARLSPETIVLKIESTATQFDTSSDALAVLKAAGVAEAVIVAMIRTSARSVPPAATPTGSTPTMRTAGPPDTPSVSPAIPKPAPAPSSTGAAPSAAKTGRALIVLQAFRVPENVTWPYNAQDLLTQTVLILKTKDKVTNRFDVAASAVESGGPVFTLDGEILSWKAGNRATRLIVGLGAGRETAEIRYWLTDEKGNKVLERRDTIRAAFWGSAVSASVGQLADPFASKLAERLDEVNLPR